MRQLQRKASDSSSGGFCVAEGSLLGDYRLLRQLGEGGMGVVYEGIQESIERRVAIKILHHELAREPELVARFLNEARASNRVSHPGIVQVTDYGKAPDGSVYIVMEFLDGSDLSSVLRSHAAGLPLSSALRYARLLAGALSAAHERGVIHRDLKPANIMLVADPDIPGQLRTKIMDFGIAKLAWTIPRMSKLSAVQTHLKTREHTVMGTPSYMAPEQCRESKDVDAKADVYSLAVMLFQLVSGRLPFTNLGPGDLIAQHILAPPPSLAFVTPDAPAALTQLVEQMLKKKPTERPSMAEVEAALSAIEAQQQWPAQAPTSSRPDGIAASGQSPSRSPLGRHGWLGVGLGLGLMIGSLLGVLWGVLRQEGRTPPRHAAPPHDSSPGLAPELRSPLATEPPAAAPRTDSERSGELPAKAGAADLPADSTEPAPASTVARDAKNRPQDRAPGSAARVPTAAAAVAPSPRAARPRKSTPATWPW